MNRTSTKTESDILESVVFSNGPLSKSAARSFLQLRFPSRDTNRTRLLLRKNNAGTIEAGERIELEKYLRVGQFLDLLHAKSRIVLKKRSHAK
jgi:hypothetical protein